jgi:hypothetical protein
VQESVDRLVSAGDTRTALRKRMAPANDQWSHSLAHTLGISPDEADLVEQDDPRSSSVYELRVIGKSGTWAAPQEKLDVRR